LRETSIKCWFRDAFKGFAKRRRSASAVVVVITESPPKKRISLRKRKVDEEEDNVEAVVEGESALVREERTRLGGRLVVVLEKTRTILDVIENDMLADDKVFNDISDMQSLEEVLAAQ
jgi:hypothetical protein